MLGLVQQVCGQQAGVGGGVGDHHAFGRGQDLHPHHAVPLHLQLRAGDRRAARPEHLAARRDRLRAEGEGCDPGRPVGAEHLAQAELDGREDRIASTLSHGEQRQLEIALSLATAPRLLLLDEPLAGMGAEETDRMLELLTALKARHAMLLIEHDMDAVFRVADVITVLVNGQLIACGSPEAVRNSPEVRVAYLGEH